MFLKVLQIVLGMASTIDTVVTSYGEGFNLLLRNLPGLFVDFIKIYLLSMILTVAFGLVFAVLLIGGSGIISGISSNIVGMLVLGIAIMGFYLIIQITATSVSAVGFGAVHERARKGQVAVIDKAKALLRPVSRYIIVATLAQLVTILPIIIVTTMMPVDIMTIAIFLVLGLLWLLFLYLVQFALPEIAVGNRDGFGAIKESVRIVKSNPIGVLLFDIVLVILILVITIAFMILNQLLAISGLMGATDLALMLVTVVVVLGLGILQSILIALLTMPAQYFYWMALGGKPGR